MSSKGSKFIERHEGFVSKAYRDPVGIVTIGTGFTNRSRTASAWWQKTRGRPIRMGDRITRDENRQLLAKAIKEEYGKPVRGALGSKSPVHAVDAGTSVSFNCGPGALKWTWAKLYKAGRHGESGARLRVTAVTARGRRLNGLVRRRKEEAALLVHGHYGFAEFAKSSVRFGGKGRPKSADEVLRQDQELLNAIGYDCGEADGLWTPKTREAVLKLQRKHGLVVDGILGPATRAKIVRLANAKRETAATGATGGTTAGSGAAADAAMPASDATATAVADLVLYGGLAVLVIGLGYLAWFYRDEISAQFRRL